MSQCKIYSKFNVAEDEPSIILEKLNKLFPNFKKEDGGNTLYDEIQTPRFLAFWGGDFTHKEPNDDGYDEFLELEKKYKNKNLYYENGEPKMFYHLGSAYFINYKGEKYILKDSKIAESDRLDIISAISYSLITNTNLSKSISEEEKGKKTIAKTFIEENLKLIEEIIDEFEGSINTIAEFLEENEQDYEENPEKYSEEIETLQYLNESIDLYVTQRLIFKKILDNQDLLKSIQEGVNSNLQGISLQHSVEDIIDNQFESEENKELQNDNSIKNQTTASTSLRDTTTMDSEIAKLISSIPDFYYENGKVKTKYNKFMPNYPMSISPNIIKNKLNKYVANIVDTYLGKDPLNPDNTEFLKSPYEKMISALEEVADVYNDETVKRILEVLEDYTSNLSPQNLVAFQNKFIKAFSHSANNYLITEINEIIVPISQTKIDNVQKTDEEQEQEKREMFDENNQANKEEDEETVVKYKLSYQNLNELADPAKVIGESLFENSASFIKYKKERNPGYLSDSNSSHYKQEHRYRDEVLEGGNAESLRALLSLYGIRLSPQTCNFLVENKNNITKALNIEGAYISLKELLDDIQGYTATDIPLDKDRISENERKVNQSNSNDATLETKLTAKGLLRIFALYNLKDNAYKSDNKHSTYIPKYELRTAIKKALNHEYHLGMFYYLGAAEAMFKPEITDSNVNINGKSQWKYSLMGGIQKELLRWKNGDINRLEYLSNKNLPFVDYLLAKDINPVDEELIQKTRVERINKLQVTIFSQIRKDQNSSDIVEFSKIGESDMHLDFLLKMFYNWHETYKTDKTTGFNYNHRRKLQQDNASVMPFDFNADGSSAIGIQGLGNLDVIGIPSIKVKDVDVVSADNIEDLNEESKEIFLSMLHGEISEINKHQLHIDKYIDKIDDDSYTVEDRRDHVMMEFIPNVHYKEKTSFTTTSDDYITEEVKDKDKDNNEVITTVIVSGIKTEESHSYNKNTGITTIVRKEYLSEEDTAKRIKDINNSSVPSSTIYNEEGNYFQTIIERDHLTGKLIEAGTYNKFGFFNSVINNIKKNKDDYNKLIISKKTTNFAINIFHPNIGDLFKIDNLSSQSFYNRGSNRLNNKLVRDTKDRDITLDDDSNTSSFPIQPHDNLAQKYLFPEILRVVKKEYDYLTKLPGRNITNTPNEIFPRLHPASIGTYILTSMINNITMFSLFNGDLMFYKQGKDGEVLTLEDALKRSGAPNKDGIYPHIEPNAIYEIDGEEFNSATEERKNTYLDYAGNPVEINRNTHIAFAVVENIEHNNSIFRKQLQDGLGTTNESVLEYGAELADATSFCTLGFYKRMMIQAQSWSEYDSKMFSEVTNHKTVLTDEHFKWLKVSGHTLQAMKLMSFDLVNVSGLQVPFFWKSAPVILVPSVVEHTSLNELHKKMLNDGIDVVAFKSASKDSNLNTTKIHKTSSIVEKVKRIVVKSNPNKETKKERVKLKEFNVANSLSDKITFKQASSGKNQAEMYRIRTIENASADATIAIAVDFTTAGEKLTKNAVENQGKKYIPIVFNDTTHLENVEKIVEELNSVNAKTLNIAGNGLYTMKGQYTQEEVDEFTYNLIKSVIESPNLKNKIEVIRSGGQSGFDEAGIKAAMKLGIKTLILAPNDYSFKDIDGNTHRDEKLFKERFNVNNNTLNQNAENNITPENDNTLISNAQTEQDILNQRNQTLDDANEEDDIEEAEIDIEDVDYETEFFDGLVNADEMKLNPFKVSLSNIKWQVELPTHFFQEGNIGTQPVKNLIANIDMVSDDKNYEYKGKALSGKEMFETYESAGKEVLKAQLEDFKKKYNIDFDTEQFNFKNPKLRSLLISQLDYAKDYDLISLLHNTETPIETVPGVVQRLVPLLFSYIKKNVGKISTNAGSVVQVSNVGNTIFTEQKKNDIAFLSNDIDLTPPKPITVLDLKLKELEKIEGIDDNMRRELTMYRKLSIKKNPTENNLNHLELLKRKYAETYVYYEYQNQEDLEENTISFEESNINDKDNTSKLKASIIKSDTNKMKMNRAKVLLPFADIQKKLGISWNEFKTMIENNRYAWETGDKSIQSIDLRIFKNILAYRIPNQSISSNDAVEVVGILPPYMGDQAVVYHEITKKAGSDFDIDKLYLALPSYNIDKVTKKVYYSDKGLKGKQNDFIEAMLSILESPVTYDDLMSPLDSDIIKDSILETAYENYLEEFEKNPNINIQYNFLNEYDEASEKAMTFNEFKKARILNPLEQVGPASKTKSRSDMLVAKSLVAIMADHMTAVGYSQAVGLEYEHQIGFAGENLSAKYVIGFEYDPEMKVTKMTSYKMNAAVDAAKDNYIIEGNINQYSANAAMFLGRSGIHPKEIFKLLMSPEIQYISKIKVASTHLSTGIRVGEYALDNNSTDIQIIQYLKYLKANPISKPFSKFDDFLEYLNKSKKIDPKELLQGYWHLLIASGKELAIDIKVNKPDGNGAGKNIFEHINLLNNLEKGLRSTIGKKEGRTFKTLTKLYKNGKDKSFADTTTFKFIDVTKPENEAKLEELTMLGVMNNNSLLLSNHIIKSMAIEGTDNYIFMINKMAEIVNGEPYTNSENIKNLSKYLYPIVLSQANHELYNMTYEQSKALIKETLELLALVKGLPDMENNTFINLLEVDKLENKIKFPNLKMMDSNDKLRLKENFKSLYLAPNYPSTFPNLNKDTLDVLKKLSINLIKYSFLDNGFKPEMNSFFDYAPHEYFIDTNHADAIQELTDRLNSLNENDDFINTCVDAALTMRAFNNPLDYTISKQARSWSYNPETKKNEFKLGVPLDLENGRLFKFVYDNGRIAPFITIHQPKSPDREKIFLCKLVDLVNNPDGTISPVYMKVKIEKINTKIKTNSYLHTSLFNNKFNRNEFLANSSNDPVFNLPMLLTENTTKFKYISPLDRYDLTSNKNDNITENDENEVKQELNNDKYLNLIKDFIKNDSIDKEHIINFIKSQPNMNDIIEDLKNNIMSEKQLIEIINKCKK